MTIKPKLDRTYGLRGLGPVPDFRSSRKRARARKVGKWLVLRDRVYIQCGGRDRVSAALAATLTQSSQLWANPISIDTNRTIMAFPVLCPLSSSNSSPKGDFARMAAVR